MEKRKHKHILLKLAGFFTLFILLSLTALYFLFHYRAGQLVEEIVTRESNGKLKTSIGKFSFQYGLRRMNITNLKIEGLDTVAGTITGCRFTTPELSLQLKSVWTLIWDKSIDIDSIICRQPSVSIYKGKELVKKEISLSEEIGNIYVSIQDVLNSLQIKRLEIKKGNIRLHGRDPSEETINLLDIDFEVDNLRIDSTQLGDQPFLFSDNVMLRSSRQNIVWDNGKRQLGFKRLYINTRKRLVEMDSCFIGLSRKGNSTARFTVLLDSLKLLRPDFRALYLDGNLTVDSIQCISPKLDLAFYIKDKGPQKDSSKLLANIFRNLTGNLSVNHIAVKNADLKIVMNQKGKPILFSSRQDNFNLSGIVISNNQEQPIKIEEINFAIRNYLTYTKDSSYAIRFDSVHFLRNRLIVSNLSVSTAPQARVNTRRSYLIPRFELADVSWSDLLFRKQLIAREALWFHPSLKVEVFKINPVRKKLTIFDVFDIVGDNLQIENLLIEDGDITYKTPAGVSLRLQEVNASVDARSLLEANSIRHIEESVNNIRFSKGIITSNHLRLTLNQANISGRNQLLRLKSLLLQNKKQSFNLQAQDVNIRGVVSNDTSIIVEAINWQTANIHWIKEKRTDSVASILEPALDLKNIYGKNTSFLLTGEDQSLHASFTNIRIPSAFYKDKMLYAGPGTGAEGKELLFISKDLSVQCDSFSINNQALSVLKNTAFRFGNSSDSIAFDVPEIHFLTSIADLQQNKNLFIKEASIINPSVYFHNNNIRFVVHGKETDKDAGIYLNDLQLPGKQWSAFIKEMKTGATEVNIKGTAFTTKFNLDAIGMNNLLVNSDNIRSIATLLSTNKNFSLSHISGNIVSPASLTSWKNLSYDNSLQKASLEDLNYRPKVEKDSFVAANPWQTDYIKTIAARVEVEGIDIPAYFTDDRLHLGHVSIHQPDIKVFRDKRPPFQAGIIKPLPVGMLQKIPVRMAIDSVSVKDGALSYTEFSPKTLQEGTIHFTRMNASLFPVKNHNFSDTDSLKLMVQAYLMDTAWVMLKMEEDYTDSLNGFMLNLRMKPTQLSVLNPMLMSAASIKLISGELDTLDMIAAGREHLSTGKMKMYYRNLKIAFLEDGDETKKTLITRVITFAINTLVIKRNNQRRTEKVFFVRNRDRSVFNYWVKMAMSGVATSVGAKKSKKYDRSYKEQLQKLGVPEIK